jgi:predicted HTH transcriptional regulator
MQDLTLILVPNGTRAQLREIFGVSYATIRKALSGIVKNPTHAKIREKALELGGMLATPNTVK